MVRKDEAVRIVQRYFLEPGDVITGVESFVSHVVVHSKLSDYEVSIDRRPTLKKSEGYHLYNVSEDFHDAVARSVAVLPDGRTYYLRDPTEFRSFIEVAYQILQPLEIAALLALFQSEENFELLLSGPDDKRIADLPQAKREALPLAPPEFETQSDGSLQMNFQTMFLGRDGQFNINLNRWWAELSPGGKIDWRVEPMARKLKSLFYSPNSDDDQPHDR